MSTPLPALGVALPKDEHFEPESDPTDKKKEKKEHFAPYQGSGRSTKEILTAELRGPLLQLLLYVLLNLDIVNKYLHAYVPALFSSSRDLNMKGIVAKGILFAVAYYLITTFAL